MLASGKIVGFVPTKDYDKARAFYEGNLGFEFISLDQYALVMSVGGHKIRIAKVSNFTPLQGTILGWEVENINLRKRRNRVQERASSLLTGLVENEHGNRSHRHVA
jgi:hypothetical protein